MAAFRLGLLMPRKLCVDEKSQIQALERTQPGAGPQLWIHAGFCFPILEPKMADHRGFLLSKTRKSDC